MTNLYAWIALLGAGISEVIWAYFMKQSAGLTKLVPSILFISIMIVSMALLTFATKYLPISIAYPVWVGIGAVGTVIAGIFLFGESASLLKFFFLALIIGGVVGLKLS
jgi:quaternary ammonium compound-resistance protein SugE